MFKRVLVAVILGITLTGFTVVPKAEAVPPNSLPPDIQQWLSFLWAQVPAARQPDIIAIRALAPAQAQRAVHNIRAVRRAVPAGTLIQGARLGVGIRDMLPPQYRQVFVNGFWGVSMAEEQFFDSVVQGVLRAVQAQNAVAVPGPFGGTVRVPPPPGGMDPGLLCSWRRFGDVLGDPYAPRRRCP